MAAKNKNTLFVYETDKPGIFKDGEGRLFNQKGLDAMAARGLAIMKIVQKITVQTGNNRKLGRRY